MRPRILAPVDPAVLIPVKRFALAKRRLAGLLDDTQRVELAQWLAGRVVAAAGALPVFVACEDEAVASWADTVGAQVLWTPGLGLNGAVESSRTTISGKGFDHLVIAHSDLPLAGDLAELAMAQTICLVPDRTGDGTNVLVVADRCGHRSQLRTRVVRRPSRPGAGARRPPACRSACRGSP